MADHRFNPMPASTSQETERRPAYGGSWPEHPEHHEEHVATPETAPALRAVASGSSVEAVGGLGAVVLAILGLAGVLPSVFAAVAAIAVGGALLFEAAGISARASRLLQVLGHDRLNTTEIEGGASVEFLGGIGGVVLGILALVGVDAAVLLPVAVIALGATMLLSSGTTSRLNAIAAAGPEADSRSLRMTHEVVSASSGGQVLAGLGGLALGILALTLPGPATTITLSLIGFLALGAASLLSGGSLTGRMMTVLRH